MKCRHCHEKNARRPRGLCWACYYVPGVRELYPITSKHAHRGVGVGINKNSSLPSEPTDSLPRSEEKLKVMEERVLRGEAVFHPQDRRIPL